MDISVIVATYNRAEQLGEALTSLIRQETFGSFTFEIVVIDNASTDGTTRLITEMAKVSRVPLRFVLEPTKGVAHARNMGIREASGEWLAFFDDDQLAESYWLSGIGSGCEEDGCFLCRWLYPAHGFPPRGTRQTFTDLPRYPW